MFDRTTYYNATLTDTGAPWWAGLVVLIIVMGISVMIRVYLAERLDHAIIETLLLWLIFSIVSILFNSLWRYGMFLYIPYITDPETYFRSDVIISVIVALGAAMFLNMIPSGRSVHLTFMVPQNEVDIVQQIYTKQLHGEWKNGICITNEATLGAMKSRKK